jgi:hypothetical protein
VELEEEDHAVNEECRADHCVNYTPQK